MTRERPKIRTMVLWTAAFALAAVSALPAAIPAQGPSRSLITIDPPGSVDTRAFAISDAGDVVGLYITADTRVHGFLLTGGVFSSIDIPGSIRTNALGITVLPGGRSGRRLAVVGRYDTPDGVAHGYRLSDGVLTTIDHPDTTFTVATGINPSGHIVGRYLGADGFFHGFTWIDGEFVTVDYPGGKSIHAMGINAQGDIAGYYEDFSGVFHGFQLIGGVFTTVDPPGSFATGAPGGIVGLNDREFVGFYRTDPAMSGCGFIFKNGKFTRFDFPEAETTMFTGVNRRGDIVGLYQDATMRRHGFLILQGALE